MKRYLQINRFVLRILMLVCVIAPRSIWGTPADIAQATEIQEAGKILPKILARPPPAFPSSLARAGVGGKVTVAFTVDVYGNVREVEVTNSDMRQLNPYAVKAVEGWKFTPGIRDGQTATFRLKGTVEFPYKGNAGPAEQIDAIGASGSAPNHSRPIAIASQTEASPQTNLRLTPSPESNTAAKPIATLEKPLSPKRRAPLVYPYDLLIAGKSGWAEADFLVDYIGRPLFTNSSHSSDHAFASAIVAMVEASVYNPIRKSKTLEMGAVKEHFDFAGEDSLDAEARRILNMLRKHDVAIAGPTELDERPRVLQQVPPVYPRALKDDGLTGQAEIEFIVDREGRVLFPRIVYASHEDFGWSAATAVAQWRFQPPLKGGRNIETKMSVPILFTSQKLAEAD